MDFKKTLLVILTFVTCMFALMLASSYAWYSYVNGSTVFDVVTNNEDINVTYSTGMYIDTKTAVPITKEEVESYSEKNKFSIDLNNEDMVGKILVDISLIDIEIDDSLKNKSFKYDLLYNGITVNTGDFVDLEENRLKMGTNITLESVSDNDFELRIYLLDDDDDQNYLMNKTFKGTIMVNVVSRLKAKMEQVGVDILIKDIYIDGKKSNNLPVKGIYNMTYSCTKNSELSWDPVSRTITYESGSKIRDNCSLTFVKDNNYEYQFLNTMPVGSYVKYTGVGGKVGDKTVICKTGANSYETIEDNPVEASNSCSGENARENLEIEEELYGYCTSDSEKYLETGWKIAYIKDEKAVIVSAGAPECISIDDSNKLSNIANSKALKYCNPKYVDNSCTCQDIDNDGLCDDKSLDAWAINNEDFNNITKSISGQGRNIFGEAEGCYNVFSNPSCGYNNTLLDNGGTYIFSDISNNYIVWEKRHVTINDKNKTYGLRPVISLSKDIKVVGGTGTMDDPYLITK